MVSPISLVSVLLLGNSCGYQGSRTGYGFESMFLGPAQFAMRDSASLIRDGESYAKYFRVPGIDPLQNFGMTRTQIYAVLVEVNKLAVSPEYDHNPATWKTLAQRLTTEAMELAIQQASRLGVQSQTPSQKADFEYVVKLQAIHEWVRAHYVYSDEIANNRLRHVDFRDAMALACPIGVCGDFTWAIVFFGSKAGLDNIYKVGGDARTSDGKNSGFTHSWNVARLPSGSLLHFDNTRTWLTIEKGIRQRGGATFSPYGLTPERWQLGFAFTYYHNQVVIAGERKGDDVHPKLISDPKLPEGNETGVDFFTRQPWAEWKKILPSKSLSNAHMFYFFLYPRK